VAGVEWVVLTNGDEYRIYNSHAIVPVEDKVFRTIRISDEQSRPDETLAVLSKEHMKDNWIDVLWKTKFVDRQIRAALDAVFGPEPDQALIRLLSRRIPTLSQGDIKAGLGRLGCDWIFPRDRTSALQNHHLNRPARLRSSGASSARRRANRHALAGRFGSEPDYVGPDQAIARS
jgi:hypothetical protein